MEKVFIVDVLLGINLIFYRDSFHQHRSETYPGKASKVSKYGVISGPYFPVFRLNTEIYSVFSPNSGKEEPEITPYFDTF